MNACHPRKRLKVLLPFDTVILPVHTLNCETVSKPAPNNSLRKCQIYCISKLHTVGVFFVFLTDGMKECFKLFTYLYII